MSQLDLAVVIVSYNVCDLLHACLTSLEQSLAASPLRAQIVVVDNASSDNSVRMIQQRFPQVTLIASRENVGFAGGNNLGLRQLGFGDPDSQLPTAVFLLNPDTTVPIGAIDALFAVISGESGVEPQRRRGRKEDLNDLEADDNALPLSQSSVLSPQSSVAQRAPGPQSCPVVVGPELRYGDGTLQSSRRRFPTVGTLFWESTLLEQWWPGNRWARRYRMDDRAADGAQVVDWLVGAALLVRSSAIQQAGLLDEGFFMYSEELEWQQRIRQMTGGQVVYWPQAVITHYEGKSSEQNLGRRHLNFQRSRLRYARQRFGPLVAWLLAGFVRLTFVIQLAVEAAKWLLGHKRPLRAARIAQYGLVLRQL